MKRDALDTLSACAPVYGGAALLPHINEIWEQLKSAVH